MLWSARSVIFADYIEIEGKYFHAEHFKCFICGTDCTAGNVHKFEGNGKILNI